MNYKWTVSVYIIDGNADEMTDRFT